MTLYSVLHYLHKAVSFLSRDKRAWPRREGRLGDPERNRVKETIVRIYYVRKRSILSIIGQ